MGRILRSLILATLVMAGWGSGAVSGQEGGRIPGPSSGSPMNAADFEALFHARADSARMGFAEADVHFIRMMIPHHSQALEMSALAKDRTTNPEILILAARITSGQTEEIARMRQWLEYRGLLEPEVVPPSGAPDGAPASAAGQNHMTHDMPGMQADGRSMPGLLSPTEMEELARAAGAEFDQLYLSYMIYHHRGAIQMVEDLFSTDGAGNEDEVFRLAAEIRIDQSTEVARMERMLSILLARIESP